jgi:uncharacterized protein YbbC (DUF1343 family)
VKATRREALGLLGGMLAAACGPVTPAPSSPVDTAAAAPGTSQPAAPGAPLLTDAAPPPAPTAAVPPTTDLPTSAPRPTTAPTGAPPTTLPPTPEPAPLPTAQAAAPTVSSAPLLTAQAAVQSGVLPGVDVLMRERKELLAGRTLGLVTNLTGRTRDGRGTIDVLHAESDWRLAALFSPEHGIRGDAAAGQGVDSSVDERTGLPIHSLYGETTRPTTAMLRGLDALVYDVQDVGARTYTYTSTLLEVMRAAAARGLGVVVLDRPDPIGGDQVEGNVLEPAFASFVGPAPIAMRYGLTIGELAQFFNAELDLHADLTVVPLRRWRRADWFDQTELAWVNPSPNLRSLSAAALYPGMVLFEATNLSEGRGTDTPFEWIGAPWINSRAWADQLNESRLSGVRFSALDRTPDSSKFAGQVCHGVQIQLVDRLQVRPMELGLSMLRAAQTLAPGRVQLMPSTFDRLAGTDRIRKAIESGQSGAQIANAWQPDLQRFKSRRERYLLYA